jgi:hypothetical protein
MAASKSQGKNLALFWTAITVLCAGIAYFGEGSGKLALLIGAAGVIVSLLGFMSIKPTEGKTAVVSGSPVMKLVGILVAWGGWFVTVVGMHLVPSVGGRMVFAIAGIVISLVGIIVVLPAAFGKSVAGKEGAASFIAAKTTMGHIR